MKTDADRKIIISDLSDRRLAEVRPLINLIGAWDTRQKNTES